MEDDPVRDILRILDKAINIEKEVLYEVTNNNSVPLDNFLNRCLSYIEKIEAIAVPVGYDSVEKGRARMAVENIYEGLQWLGINWDESPVIQSERQKDLRGLHIRPPLVRSVVSFPLP